jgi:hypothetical protein
LLGERSGLLLRLLLLRLPVEVAMLSPATLSPATLLLHRCPFARSRRGEGEAPSLRREVKDESAYMEQLTAGLPPRVGLSASNCPVCAAPAAP